jgi:protein involved in polysaccharide export with SLBB domain
MPVPQLGPLHPLAAGPARAALDLEPPGRGGEGRGGEGRRPGRVRTTPKWAVGFAPAFAQWLWSAFLLLLLASCTTTPDKRVLQYLNTHGFGNRYTGNAEEENYVNIGDSFQWVNEYDPAGLNGLAQIDIDGTIVLPQVGSVAVAGNTRSELESYLTLRLSQYVREVDIKVTSMNTKGKYYFVYGEVLKSGPVLFPGNLTIFEAVMLAGPEEFSANLGRVRLVRGDPRDPLIITVNLRDIINGDTTYNVLVHERDIIVVPPTLLAQFSNFIAGIVVPFTTVLQQFTLSLFQIQRANSFGNNNNGNFNLF